MTHCNLCLLGSISKTSASNTGSEAKEQHRKQRKPLVLWICSEQRGSSSQSLQSTHWHHYSHFCLAAVEEQLPCVMQMMFLTFFIPAQQLHGKQGFALSPQLSAVAQSWLTAVSTSQTQVIPPPKPPEDRESYHVIQAGLEFLGSSDALSSSSQGRVTCLNLCAQLQRTFLKIGGVRITLREALI
ncbi:hypothetical protein AAY473_004303 [Plecturocebus cupreus]